MKKPKNLNLKTQKIFINIIYNIVQKRKKDEAQKKEELDEDS